MRIDGKKIAAILMAKLKKKVAKLDQPPTLIILQIGTLPEASIYISEKKRAGKRIGIKVLHCCLPENVAKQEIINRVEQYNNNPAIAGIIVQLPLPPQLNSDTIISKIASTKDVDGFLPNSPYRPPVACAVLKVLQISLGGKLSSIRRPAFLQLLRSKQIAIIGRGRTGGRPIMNTFDKMEIPYILIHRQTENPTAIMQAADIIISCVGKPNIVTSAKIKPGVILISVGIHRAEDGKLCGDYELADIQDKAAYFTPTPGGIGPLTVACLMHNVLQASTTNAFFHDSLSDISRALF